MSITINFGDVGRRNRSKIPVFTYTGTYEFAKDENDENWELALKTGGTLTFTSVPAVDIYLVGGGAKGGKGYAASNNQYLCYGGAGGKGGYRRLVANTTIAPGAYTIVIGGSGAATTGFGYTAASGGGSAGGASGYATWGGGSKGTAGTNGKYAFDGDNETHAVTNVTLVNFRSWRFGAGGGGAPARSAYATSGSTDYTYNQTGAAAGGVSGGGNSGSNPAGSSVVGQRIGYAGTTNTGSGGGGSCGDRLTGTYPDGGNGGSGIIIIRNAR